MNMNGQFFINSPNLLEITELIKTLRFNDFNMKVLNVTNGVFALQLFVHKKLFTGFSAFAFSDVI